MKINRFPEDGIVAELSAGLELCNMRLSLVRSIELSAEEYELLIRELGVADRVHAGQVLGSIQGIPLLVDGRSPLASGPAIVIPNGPAH